jgi:hypothetical protein
MEMKTIDGINYLSTNINRLNKLLNDFEEYKIYQHEYYERNYFLQDRNRCPVPMRTYCQVFGYQLFFRIINNNTVRLFGLNIRTNK